jgi:hypothetical protein
MFFMVLELQGRGAAKNSAAAGGALTTRRRSAAPGVFDLPIGPR